jgi:hypothetical protein
MLYDYGLISFAVLYFSLSHTLYQYLSFCFLYTHGTFEKMLPGFAITLYEAALWLTLYCIVNFLYVQYSTYSRTIMKTSFLNLETEL